MQILDKLRITSFCNYDSETTPQQYLRYINYYERVINWLLVCVITNVIVCPKTTTIPGFMMYIFIIIAHLYIISVLGFNIMICRNTLDVKISQLQSDNKYYKEYCSHLENKFKMPKPINLTPKYDMIYTRRGKLIPRPLRTTTMIREAHRKIEN